MQNFPVLVVTLRHIRFEVQGEKEGEVDDPSSDAQCPRIVFVTA